MAAQAQHPPARCAAHLRCCCATAALIRCSQSCKVASEGHSRISCRAQEKGRHVYEGRRAAQPDHWLVSLVGEPAKHCPAAAMLPCNVWLTVQYSVQIFLKQRAGTILKVQYSGCSGSTTRARLHATAAAAAIPLLSTHLARLPRCRAVRHAPEGPDHQAVQARTGQAPHAGQRWQHLRRQHLSEGHCRQEEGKGVECPSP